MARRRRDEQPISVPSGLPHGQRQLLEAAQREQPLPRQDAPAPARGPAAPPEPGAAPMLPADLDVFGPSTRGGAMDEPGMLPPDPVGFLRAIAMQYPSPGIERLLERAARRGRRL